MSDKLRRDLDIRLLRTLRLLLTEASVSRVAEILGQSQPAVSGTLRQLRDILGDPLLVRSGSRLVPTERGLQLLESVGQILRGIDALARPAEDFDPRQSRRRARVVASTCLGVLLLPRLVELVREAAPNVEIDLCTLPAGETLARALESGEVDLVMGNWPDPAPNLRFAPLIETDIVCMMRPAHPLSRERGLPLDTYLKLDHISPSPASNAPLSPIDGRLAQLSRPRNVVVSVPEYSLVPYVLTRADLVFTTARPFAEHLASMMPLSVMNAPAELGRMRFYLLWHERAHHSPFEKWLRGLIRRAVADVTLSDTSEPRHKPTPIGSISAGPIPTLAERTSTHSKA